MITIGVIIGVLVMLALQAANAERLMRPETFQDETWGASLFSTSWATGALAAAAVIQTTGSPQESGIGSDLLTATAVGAFTWGARLLIRQGMQDRAKALQKLGRTEEQGTARERLALQLTKGERDARSALEAPRNTQRAVRDEETADDRDPDGRQRSRNHDGGLLEHPRGNRVAGGACNGRGRRLHQPGVVLRRSNENHTRVHGRTNRARDRAVEQGDEGPLRAVRARSGGRSRDPGMERRGRHGPPNLQQMLADGQNGQQLRTRF